MTSRDLRVLLVGAAGVFGRLILEQLAAEPDIYLITAGRTQNPLDALRCRFPGKVRTHLLDRNTVTRKEIKSLGVDVVIDAAGPFQDSDMRLVDAAIMANCHYVDIADGRIFVTGIRRFDNCARKRSVSAVSGASATPALSNAVLDHLTDQWKMVETIRVTICPGNRSPRGLAVVRGVFSYIGKPLRVFRDGTWTSAPGWGLTRKVAFPEIGTRYASLCETPDLDLLVERFKPKKSAEFYAGLELPVLHLGLSAAGMMVRTGVLASLVPLARPMLALSLVLRAFGTDIGAMMVEASGKDAAGTPVLARWSLIAKAGTGPHVPTLATVALVRRIRDQNLPFVGARPCVGMLTLADFESDFERLGIRTTIERR